ncbi:MAG: HAMP domain-containing sensor histidine kinase [Flavobacteriaceae bacterium]|nr:HAMP domain-containing histidine kinase [Flavobacteriaceae bacterium]
MNALREKRILYFIATVIVATLCIQVYWNYKNYQAGRQQFINDVQTSLDNAVDQYYTQLATNSSFKFIGDTIHFSEKRNFSQFSFKTDSLFKIDTLSKGLSIFKSHFKDSLGINISIHDSGASKSRSTHLLKFIDSVNNPVEILSSKIMVSFSEDELSLHKIDSLLKEELTRKNIEVDYGLSTATPFGKGESLRPEMIEKAPLETSSKSPFFLHGTTLSIHFSNITFLVLKRNLLGILLSFLLVSGVIASFLYLLKIIRQQKQLAELKNDLISNITHEFKTPIATIGVALEALQNFNKENDTEKKQRYTKISREQVDKLNVMVEKLLETATLDSEALTLKLEPCNLVALVEKAIQKEAFITKEKTLHFYTSTDAITLPLDVFHFENAINNIIDNALKYGGDTITISLQKREHTVEIAISDSGNSLNETQKKQLFEKFYRIPRGNTHDVKGFGIGLYYTKKIIEKHQGTIELIPQPHTTFKITLPHG